MSKYTKGPWSFNDERLCLSNKEKKLLDISTGLEPSRANARLIAAAPEMFEALEYALEFLVANDDKESDVTDRIDAVKKAIAKAKGE